MTAGARRSRRPENPDHDPLAQALHQLQDLPPPRRDGQRGLRLLSRCDRADHRERFGRPGGGDRRRRGGRMALIEGRVAFLRLGGGTVGEKGTLGGRHAAVPVRMVGVGVKSTPPRSGQCAWRSNQKESNETREGIIVASGYDPPPA